MMLTVVVLGRCLFLLGGIGLMTFLLIRLSGSGILRWCRIVWTGARLSIRREPLRAALTRMLIRLSEVVCASLG